MNIAPKEDEVYRVISSFYRHYKNNIAGKPMVAKHSLYGMDKIQIANEIGQLFKVAVDKGYFDFDEMQ